MRVTAIILAILWLSSFVTNKRSEAEKQDRIDSLMAINKTLMDNLKKANDDIKLANEIIEDPSLVVRFNGVAVQVFHADTTKKNGNRRNK